MGTHFSSFKSLKFLPVTILYIIAIDISVKIAKTSTLKTPVKWNSLSFVPVNKRYLKVITHFTQIMYNFLYKDTNYIFRLAEIFFWKLH